MKLFVPSCPKEQQQGGKWNGVLQFALCCITLPSYLDEMSEI